MKRVLGTPLVDYLPALALIAITIVYLVTAYSYQPEARDVPAGVAWAMLLFLVLDVISRTGTSFGETLMHWLNPAGDPAKAEARPHYDAWEEISTVLWIFGLVGAMALIGILYTVPLFVLAWLKFRGRRALWLSAIIAAGAVLAIWALFEFVLHIELYPGLLFGDA